MRRALAVAGPLCLASAVWASWQVISVPGVPADVEIGDAGVPEWYAIATGTGAYGFVGDAGDGQLTVAGGAVGVLIDTRQSCFAAVEPTGCATQWNGACNAGTGPSGLLDTCARARSLLDGGAFLAAPGGFAGNLEYSPTGGKASDWGPGAPGITAAPGAAIGVLHGSTVDYALLLIQSGTFQLKLCASSTLCSALQSTSLSAAQDIEMLGNGAPDFALVAQSAGALARVDLDGGAPVALPLPVAPTAIGGLSLQLGTGDAFGDGFGMLAVTLPGGTPGILSAVPDPANPGRTWLPNTVPLPAMGFTAGFHHLRCLDGRVCVALTDATGSQNVLLYHNDFAPDAGLPASISVVPNIATAYNFDAGDGDGDAVFLSWNAPGGGIPFGFLVQDKQGLSVVVDAGPGLACGTGPQSYPFTVVASDGYAPHNRTFTVPFVVSSAGNASPPVVSPDGGLIIIQAGAQSSVSLQFSVADGGCAAASFNVSTLSSIPGVSVQPSGTSATVTIPADWCSPVPGVSTFLVSPQGASGDAGTVVEVEVLPWGVPLEPLDAGVESRTQIAGTTARYGPEQTHVCDDGGSTFPGVQTVWSAILPLPAGASVADAGNNSVDVTLGCAPQGGPLSLNVYNLTKGSTEVSRTDRLDIQQSLAFPALGSLALSAGQAEPVPVTLTLTPPPPCAAQRGLYAVAALEYLDGGLVSQGQGAFDAGGVAFVPLAYPGCTGGQFLVTGQAFFDGGAPGPVAQTQQVTAPALRAAIADAGFVSPVAQCTGPATGGSITAYPPAQDGGICQQLSWSWSQNVADGGPHVASLAVNSPMLPLSTVETGFGLIGDQLDLVVSATGRPGDTATLERSVPILAPLFVNVTHQTDTARPEESSAFGVRVTLTNTSGCDVSGVDFQEMADNMIAVPGSARAAGVPAQVSGGEASLLFGGLTLPAGASVSLTYLARPKLLAHPAPHGLALIKGVPISSDSGLPTPSSGCGCTGAPGVSLIGWALAVLALRRRRQKL